MKKKINVIGMLTALLLALFGAGVASAKAVGEDYSVYGYNFGYVILGLAIALIFIFILMKEVAKVPKHVTKVFIIAILAMLTVGGIMSFVTVAPTASVTPTNGLPDMQFSITPSVPTGHYPDTTFDKASGVFTVPFRANTSSHTIRYAAANTTYALHPVLNFTIVPEFPDSASALDLSLIYFEITNPSIAVGDDATHYAITKTDGIFQAKFTDQDGAVSYVSGWTGGGITSTLTVSLDLSLYGTGLSYSTKFSPTVLDLTFHNKANSWSQTYQIALVATVVY